MAKFVDIAPCNCGARSRQRHATGPAPGTLSVRRAPSAGVPRHGPPRTPRSAWANPPHHHRVDAQAGAGATLVAMSAPARRSLVELLTRDGCTICARVHARLAELADELGFDLSTTDVDAVASAGNPGLRAEFGDRLPVILLDGREHSYWEIDEPRLRADLAR